MTSTKITRHLQERSALLHQETTTRHDYAFKTNMSPVAKSAAEIVARIRQRESEIFWTTAEGSHHEGKHPVVFPGMSFAISRDRMHQTSLYQIVSAMPKGCLLHAHMEAMIDIDWMLDQALEIPGFWISSPAPLKLGASAQPKPFEFHYRPNRPVATATASIWEDDYPPHALIPVAEAARTHPSGESGFRSWAIAQMTITEDEALYHHHRGIFDVWKKFASCFRRIAGLFYAEPIFRRGVPRLLQQLHSDGIKYAELRLVPRPFHREGSDHPEPDARYFFECFAQELQRYCASPAGQGFWGARMIWTAIRSLPDEDIRASMQACLDCKAAYPDLIAGFDFVGQEDLGRPLVDLLPHCEWFQEECTQRNLQIPFFFHAGECLGDGDATDGNLVDAILLQSRRIGHAFSLYKHPLLIEMVKERRILIEMCPISHEILRLTANILTHPMPALQARGVPVSLNNDDPAILGHGGNGLSYDFYQVLIAFENTGLGGLATMAEDSVRWAAFEDETEAQWLAGVEGTMEGVKASRLQQWRAAFEDWCQWIVQEFAQELEESNPKVDQ
ncbi:Metallo-dependent hydrolase [Aspergillus saccharolyticus JOP 1030-1]|uniref:adenosine deaminase n=1 Tax=Aspergillus saccharolyticus JOP 1030-1 TaxID=1450539 RepID=A0A318Z9I0_9EURO|nr:Metallo-dependent hydrolase [Aspergillus saccharolyticus JOP 1030-1]PYH44061.1 Metallo-dependent hydrolase [Aspergillus saccharolyticus JOP 1030-1]